jgi:hypothetical protein
MTRALVLAVLLVACAPTAVTPAPSASASASTSSASVTAASTPLVTASPSSTPSPQPSPTATPTPGLLPIFDAHLHYSREAWGPYPPARVAALLDAAGVRTALVSSAPDEGTFRLRDLLGDRVVPTLGTYRSTGDVFSWPHDGAVLPYLETSYRAGVHKGLGEFHLNSGQVGLPVVQQVIAFARTRGLFLQAHADARAIAELLEAVGSDYNVLWAHAGVTATPDQIEILLARWPKLWVELSLRDDVAPKGELDPRWRALFVRYPDRFMVGTDTWTVGGPFTGNERWDIYADIVRGIRGWLSQLPADLAERIAHLNAERFIAQFR